VRRASCRDEPHAKHATRCRAETVFGRLSVDEKLAARSDSVCRHRTIAATFFARDEHKADVSATRGAQALRGRDLRGENAFRVAGATPIEHAILFTTGEKRRHAVEVR
jgi:hypothetical protein